MQKVYESGIRAGVTGTPGAQPLESFARLIDEELARAR